MPDFKGIENLRLILFFIVPGLITVFVRSRFIVGRSPTQSEQLLSYLVLSVIYYAIVLPYVIYVFAGAGGIYEQSFHWAILTLIGPTLFGFMLGAVAQKRWMHRLVAWFGLTMVDIIPPHGTIAFLECPAMDYSCSLRCLTIGRLQGCSARLHSHLPTVAKETYILKKRLR